MYAYVHRRPEEGQDGAFAKEQIVSFYWVQYTRQA